MADDGASTPSYIASSTGSTGVGISYEGQGNRIARRPHPPPQNGGRQRSTAIAVSFSFPRRATIAQSALDAELAS
jgi:hypothetical protein